MINRELAERIPGGVKWGTNGEGQIRCPFHDDKNPSCSINTEKNTFICHACGEKGTLSFLLARCGIEAPKQSHSEIAYDYTDEAGKLVYQVVRIDTDTGKDFYQRRPDDAGDWITKGAMKDVKRLPMTLGEALDALAADEVIKSAMPDEMYRVYEHYKRDEWARFNATVTEWDLDTYMDCLP